MTERRGGVAGVIASGGSDIKSGTTLPTPLRRLEGTPPLPLPCAGLHAA
eukprot:CAMPEP_0175329716 /NCGR_PEP_ID=MMETSP0095-20121207/349_1 /TAXON_ID=311494 /ORGANISM="Alexandrium monilatum, Strain CCMP3105" /LENGTH=48 /DNA_ID= /DNA_START= /DNA_END= /DNA_ORIENTATION=